MKSPTFVKQGLLVGKRNRITGAFLRNTATSQFMHERVSHSESSDERTSSFMRTARSDARCAVWRTWMVFNVQLAPTNAIITVLIAYLCIETVIFAAVACDDFGALVPEWSETTSVICSYTALLPSGLPQRIPRYLALYTESSHNLEVLAMESWEGSVR